MEELDQPSSTTTDGTTTSMEQSNLLIPTTTDAAATSNDESSHVIKSSTFPFQDVASMETSETTTKQAVGEPTTRMKNDREQDVSRKDQQPQSQEPVQQPSTPKLDAATAQKILRFWNHPSLQGVAASQKQDYLKQQGFSQQQLLQAVEYQIQQESNSTNVVVPTQQQQQQNQPPQTLNPNTGQSPAYPHSNPNYNYPQQPPNPTSQYGNHSNYDSHYGSNSYNYQYTNPPYGHEYVAQEDDDMSTTVPQMALVAAIGGALGLAAAATVRWLNGGDFLLFPPAQQMSNSATKTGNRILSLRDNNTAQMDQEATTEDSQDDDENVEQEGQYLLEDDDDDEEETVPLARYLSQSSSYIPQDENDHNHIDHGMSPHQMLQETMTSFQSLSETMRQHVTVQQRILQKLSAGGNTSITDQSMKMLRQQISGVEKKDFSKSKMDNPLMWYKLVEIQVQLTHLQQHLSSTNTKNETTDSTTETAIDSDTVNNTTTGSATERQVVTSQLQDVLSKLKSVLEELQPTLTAKTTTVAAAATTTTTETLETTKSAETTETKLMPDDTPTKVDSISNSAIELSNESEVVDVKASASIEEKSNTGNLEQTTAAESDQQNESTTPAAATVVPKDDPPTDEHQNLRNIRQAVIDLVRQNVTNVSGLKAACQILFLYVSNLAKNPHLPRFRKVHTSNESFQKVATVAGGKELLGVIGFVESADGKLLEWPPVVGFEEDGVTPKTLTSQEKEALVEQYHLSQVAAALAIVKSVTIHKHNAEGKDEQEQMDEIMSKLEKALEVLPCPP